MTLDDLKNRHAGETASIVGKGGSLRNLRPPDLGKAGPIFGINQAVLDVESQAPKTREIYLVQQGGVVQLAGRLTRATALVPLSKERYYRDYEKRCTFEPICFGETAATLSTEMAVILAIHMGCVKFVMLCFDALMLGDDRLSYPQSDTERIEKQLGKYPRVWAMPRKRGK